MHAMTSTICNRYTSYLSSSPRDQVRLSQVEQRLHFVLTTLVFREYAVQLTSALCDVFSGEFMVLVEYCRHGNLHQYLHRHKNSFINQVHPITGELGRCFGQRTRVKWPSAVENRNGDLCPVYCDRTGVRS